MSDSTQRFSRRADHYVRYRPGYPAEVITLLRAECGLGHDAVVADIGSGTGKLTELLLPNAARVFAVEPNRQMREAGERLLSSSYVPLEGEEHEAMLARLGDIFAAYQRDGRVEFLYDTTVYYGRSG